MEKIFNGKIDQVKCYDHALTSRQIEELYFRRKLSTDEAWKIVIIFWGTVIVSVLMHYLNILFKI